MEVPAQQFIMETSCSIIKPDSCLDGKGYLREQIVKSIQKCSNLSNTFKAISIIDFGIRMTIMVKFFQQPEAIYNILLFTLCSVFSIISIVTNLLWIKKHGTSQKLLMVLSSLGQFDSIFFMLSKLSQIKTEQNSLSLDYKELVSNQQYLVCQFQLKRFFYGFLGLLLFNKLISNVNSFSISDYSLLTIGVLTYIFINHLYLKIFILENNYGYLITFMVMIESIMSYSLSVFFFVGVVEMKFISYLISLIAFFLVISKLEHASGKLFDPFVVGPVDQILLGGQFTFILPLLKKDYNLQYMLFGLTINKINFAIFSLYQIMVQIQVIMDLKNNKETYLSTSTPLLIIYQFIIILNIFFAVCKLAIWLMYLIQKKQITTSDLTLIDLNEISRLRHVDINLQSKSNYVLEERDFQVIEHLLNSESGFISITFNKQFLIQIIKGHIEIIIDYISQRKQLEKLYLMALNQQKSINIDIIFDQQSKKEINLFMITLLKNNVIENEEKHLQSREYLLSYFKKCNQAIEVIPITEDFNHKLNEALLTSTIIKNQLSPFLINNPYLISYDLYEDF